MYVEELIGPDSVNTMPLETIRRVPGSRRDPRRHGPQGRRQGAEAARGTPRGGRRLRRRRRDARGRRRPEVRRRLRRDRRQHPREARSTRRSMSKTVVERIWARDPTIWTGSDEASWLGWLDEPGRMRGDVELLLQFADTRGRPDRRGRAARHGRLVARARGDQADVQAGDVPRSRHDASAGDPRSRGDDRRVAHAVHLRVEVGLDARDPLAHRLLLGAESGRRELDRDHGSGLRAGEPRARAGRLPPCSSASRRSGAATRRSRPSGWCRRR